MAVSVRMDPLLEKELELAARRKGEEVAYDTVRSRDALVKKQKAGHGGSAG